MDLTVMRSSKIIYDETLEYDESIADRYICGLLEALFSKKHSEVGEKYLFGSSVRDVSEKVA